MQTDYQGSVLMHEEPNPWTGNTIEARFNILPYLLDLRDWLVGKRRKKREEWYWEYEICGCRAYSEPYCPVHGFRRMQKSINSNNLSDNGGRVR